MERDHLCLSTQYKHDKLLLPVTYTCTKSMSAHYSVCVGYATAASHIVAVAVDLILPFLSLLLQERLSVLKCDR